MVAVSIRFIILVFMLINVLIEKARYNWEQNYSLPIRLKILLNTSQNAYPELNIDPNTDYKRVGVFVGHELFINRISLEAQAGLLCLSSVCE